MTTQDFLCQVVRSCTQEKDDRCLNPPACPQYAMLMRERERMLDQLENDQEYEDVTGRKPAKKYWTDNELD